MELKKAQEIANEFIDLVKDQYLKIEIVGSIRREKAEVKDIDLVAIPKNKVKEKIIRMPFKDISIDLYVANEKNFECLKLIRTGSALHNIKLCSHAKRRGWQLKANGEGLITKDNILHGEKEILTALLGGYIEPKYRN